MIDYIKKFVVRYIVECWGMNSIGFCVARFIKLDKFGIFLYIVLRTTRRLFYAPDLWVEN